MAIGSTGGKDVGKIRIRLGVDGDGLSREIDDELGKAERKSSSKIGQFAKRLGIATGAAIGAAAAKSVFDFTGFERQMNEVFTLLPGISDKAMKEMTGQVKDFSKEFGVLPDKVVPALYQALSAGVPKDNVFEFLETAQKAAKGGVTDLTTAVDGISSVVNAYGADVLKATQASDLMFTAVRLGKTNFQELSQSLFNVTPTTAALGVSFGDVTAALAAMTAQGVPTSVATTQLRQLFVELSKEGTNTSKVFKEIAGKSFKDFIAGGGNVQDALQLLETHASKTGLGVNDLFGSVEAGAAALSLTGSGTEAFSKNLEEMGGSAGATQAAFDQMNKGVGPVFDRVRSAISVGLLDLGGAIVGFATTVVDGFKRGEEAGDSFAAKFGSTLRPVVDFIKANAIPIVAGLGVVIAAVLVPALWSAVTAVAALFSPAVLIVGALALLVGAVVYAYNNFEGFRNVVDSVAQFLVGTVWPKIQQFAGYIAEQFGKLVGWVREHWGAIQEAISHVANVIRGFIETWIGVIQGAWKTWGDELLNIARIIWDQIRNTVETFINIIRGVIETVLALINGDWGKAWDGIKSILSAAWEFMRESTVNVLRIIGQVIEGAMSGIRAAWNSVWDGMAGVVSSVWGRIEGIVSGGVRAVGNVISGFLRAVAGVADAIGADGIAGSLRGAADSVNGWGERSRTAYSGNTSGGDESAYGFAAGGRVPGFGNGDTVPAWLTPGEFVMRKDAVKAIGLDNLQAMNAQRFAEGGLVGTVGGWIKSGLAKARELAAAGLGKLWPKLPVPDNMLGIPPAAANQLREQVLAVIKGKIEEKAKALEEATAAQGRGGGLSGSSSGLDPEFLSRFNAWNSSLGGILSITSGFRSRAQQQRLYDMYLAGTGNLAAPPGSSMHERGLAIDHAPSGSGINSSAGKFRLHHPVGGEPWHVEPFHSGGIVPGPRGSEMLALLEAGERITPAGGDGAVALDDATIAKIAAAMKAGPAPVVSVSEINHAQYRVRTARR